MLSPNRRYPVAFVCQELCSGIFCTLGRLESLARCRDSQTGRYRHIKVANVLGEREAHNAISAAHELVWQDWMRGSLEQQHADLLLYARSQAKGAAALTELVSNWLKNSPFPGFPPPRAGAQERALFLENLKSVLARVQSRAQSLAPSFKPSGNPLPPVLAAIQRRFSDPDLSLGELAKEHGIARRHLGRLMQQRLGKTFRRYLRELRLAQAVHLLASSSHEIKTVAGMVGYRYASRFGRDFHLSMNCTPAQFRKEHAIRRQTEQPSNFEIAMSDL